MKLAKNLSMSFVFCLKSPPTHKATADTMVSRVYRLKSIQLGTYTCCPPQINVDGLPLLARPTQIPSGSPNYPAKYKSFNKGIKVKT
ncbi:MAG: hypothetical protein AAFQ94_07515 [Bacteroidota bacterium]